MEKLIPLVILNALDQALADVIDRGETHGGRRIGLFQRVDGLRRALAEILQRGRVGGVIDRRTIGGEERCGKKEDEEGAHGVN